MMARLSLFLFCFFCSSLSTAQSTHQDSISPEELDNFLNEQQTYSGAVLLARNNDVLFTSAGGFATKRFNVPNNLETKFNLGSMNKMFTAVGIMQLVESEKLALDDPLSKYLDETWLAPTVSEQIQIQHLLSHASGLGSYFTRDFFNSSRRLYKKLDDFKPLVKTDTPRFKPGTSYRYSNTGMLLLGAVIEAVTGQSYFDYIKHNIYEVAGMANSGCYEMDQPIPNLAIGYNANADNETGWENNLFWHVVKGGPAGGCFSTVTDLYRFATALTSNKFLNKANTELLFVPQSQFHNEKYGFGFRSENSAKGRRVGHGGGFVGIDANLDIFLDTGYVAIVLSNHGGGADKIVDKIRELIEQMP